MKARLKARYLNCDQRFNIATGSRLASSRLCIRLFRMRSPAGQLDGRRYARPLVHLDYDRVCRMPAYYRDKSSARNRPLQVSVLRGRVAALRHESCKQLLLSTRACLPILWRAGFLAGTAEANKGEVISAEPVAKEERHSTILSCTVCSSRGDHQRG